MYTLYKLSVTASRGSDEACGGEVKRKLLANQRLAPVAAKRDKPASSSLHTHHTVLISGGYE